MASHASILCIVLLSIHGVFLLDLERSHHSESCVVQGFGDIQKALQECDEIILDNLTIPGGEPLILHLRDNSRVIFRGTTTFEYAHWLGPLVQINGSRVIIEGEPDSVLNGKGPEYWDGLGEWGVTKPTFFTIQLHDSIMRNINILNAPRHCVYLVDSNNVTLSGWNIDDSAGDENVAGKDKAGHNTDGFDVFNVTDSVIRDSYVHSQDDCVAIRCGNNITVENMVCIGGHGLSLSVGFSNDSFKQNTLTNVVIRNSYLQGGENGIHIKTHLDAGFGYLENITYSNIQFEGPKKYGIILHENYKNLPANSSQPAEPRNNIPIKNLFLEDIAGSVDSTAVPVYICCADDGCFDWTFDRVTVTGTKNNSCNFLPDNFSC